MVTFEDFLKLDIRVGEIIKVENFEEANKKAYKVWVNFGDKIGVKKTSAQITACYSKEELLSLQVLGVINFPPKQIKNFMSEFLLLGIYSDKGVILITPNKTVNNGEKLG